MDSVTLAYCCTILTLVLFSAFFSASETAYSALNKIRLKTLAAEGSKSAAHALALVDQYDKLLSTILIGNNIVNIASTSIATLLFVKMLGNKGVSVSTVVMTVAILIIGEITPKTIAKESSEKFAMFAAPFLRLMMIVLAPLNGFFSWWKKFVVALFHIDLNKKATTEQELLSFVEEVRREGSINTSEEGMIKSAIEFDDLQAVEICTPRVDIEAVSETDTPEKIAAVFRQSRYSRLPVYHDSVDQIVGMILDKDFHYLIEAGNRNLSDIVRPVYHCPKSTKISTLLKTLQEKKIHMAIVIDELGGTLGLVTMEDILEELVGEIWDEHDEIKRDIVRITDRAYLFRGEAPFDDLAEIFHLAQDDTDAITVAGWVVEKLGKIPYSGERFTADALTITIKQMRKNRIERILVESASPPPETQDA